jgi:hypothetical protein
MRSSTVIVSALLLPLLGACSQGGPTTRADLCKEFSTLGHQLLQGNGVIGNPLFRQTKELGSVAKRYPDDEGVQSDGKALVKIGKSDSLSGEDLMNASQHISDVCGHPLGIGGYPTDEQLPPTRTRLTHDRTDGTAMPLWLYLALLIGGSLAVSAYTRSRDKDQ